MTMFTFELDDVVAADVDKAAKGSDMNRSAWLRQAVRDCLDRCAETDPTARTMHVTVGIGTRPMPIHPS